MAIAVTWKHAGARRRERRSFTIGGNYVLATLEGPGGRDSLSLPPKSCGGP